MFGGKKDGNISISRIDRVEEKRGRLLLTSTKKRNLSPGAVAAGRKRGRAGPFLCNEKWGTLSLHVIGKKNLQFLFREERDILERPGP